MHVLGFTPTFSVAPSSHRHPDSCVRPQAHSSAVDGAGHGKHGFSSSIVEMSRFTNTLPDPVHAEHVSPGPVHAEHVDPCRYQCVPIEGGSSLFENLPSVHYSLCSQETPTAHTTSTSGLQSLFRIHLVTKEII